MVELMYGQTGDHEARRPLGNAGHAEPPPNGWGDFTSNPPPGWPSGPQTNPPGWPSQAVQDGWVGGPGGHRRKSRAWLWALAAVTATVVLCFGALALLSTGAEPQGQTVIVEPSAETFTSMGAAPKTGQGNSTAQASKAPAKTRVAGIGDKVRVEGLQYQTHSVVCRIKHVGLKDFGRSAQGQFCRVDLTVTNLGDKARFWDADTNVEAEDTRGREFSADGEAGIYGNKNGAGFLDEINPGNSVRAFVFFDLPKGAKLAKLEFTAGLFGDEAEVRV